MLSINPDVADIKKVGHDLGPSIGSGLTDVFRNVKKLFCTEHLQKADQRKLKDMGANSSTINKIMADIYCTRRAGSVEELVLVDSCDPEDFDVKLESLKIAWNGLLPSFHNWFIIHRADIIRSKLILSARTKLNISGWFYTNGLESAHGLQKNFLAEEGHKPVNVVEVSVFLEHWINEFYTELVTALRGMERYRLAVGYQDFFVEPVKWNQWSPDRYQKHVDKFLSFV